MRAPSPIDAGGGPPPEAEPERAPRFAAADLRDAAALALDRGGHLLAAGELAVVRGALALPEPALDLLARLSSRVPRPLRRDTLPEPAAAELAARGFLSGLVPWPERARASTVPELADALRRLGLDPRGRKEDLVARLAGRAGWSATRWVRLHHRALLVRIRRWAALDVDVDDPSAVLERMGRVRWPAYATTPGPALHPDRRALLAWEALVSERDPERLLAGYAAGAAPGRLDLRPRLLERVREAAEAASPEVAAGWYARWPGRRAAVGFRHARALEALGDPAGAWRVLRDALTDALTDGGATDGEVTDEEATALARAGLRVARRLGTSFPPRPPRPPLRTRSWRLPSARPSPEEEPEPTRPRYATPGAGHAPIESAVVAHLAARGRSAVHGEGAPWRTLASLLLAPLYFLPVPGALPVPRLPGPLDLGTPAFAAARAPALGALLDAIDPGAVGPAFDRWAGVRLAGVHPEVPRDLVVSLAEALPLAALRALVAARARGRTFAGMPDLLVLPGPPTALPGALPAQLGPGLVAAELKGPTDRLRDGQAAWLADLAAWGVGAELWEISGS